MNEGLKSNARGSTPPRAHHVTSHNLPLELSPLIGRSSEIADVSELVVSDRLVTLTGSGGVGKTRLALAVGSDRLTHFPGGAWFVDLASTGGVGSTARATLRALAAPEAPSISPDEQVVVELREREPALLILDNCEHTLDDCARFATALLTREPNVTVLATSRELLGVPGEIAWQVPPLATPMLPSVPTAEPTTAEAFARYDAVELFVDRARRARPSFTLTDANAAAVAQICDRLDGIPLAIELAAARCRHLTEDRILAELDDRFRLLTGGSRQARARQQTMTASVEWSHDLLTPDERVVLRRLGVFAGPFELDAAEAAVSELGDVDRINVFDLLCRLVDKSLLLITERQDGARFRVLETIRAFALDQARLAGELATLRDAHAGWWRDRLSGLVADGPTDDAVRGFEVCHDDIVGALSWAADHDVVLGLELVRMLAGVMEGAGCAGEAMPACERLLGTTVEAEHPQEWLDAAVPISRTVFGHRGMDAYIALLDRCERVATALRDEDQLTVARWFHTMDLEWGAKVVELAHRRGDRYLVALGTVYQAIHTPLGAPGRARRALTEASRVANDYPSGHVRSCLAVARGVQELVFGHLPTAIECGRELRTDRTATMRRFALLLLGCGGLLSDAPDVIEDALDTATRDAARGIPHAREIADNLVEVLAMMNGTIAAPSGPPPSELHSYVGLFTGREAVNRGDLDGARTIADRLAGCGPAFEASRSITLGLLDGKEDDWHRALRRAAEHGFRLFAVDALEGLGVAAAASDSSIEALRLFGAADRLRDETRYRWRFPIEHERHDGALAAARDDAGAGADDGWKQGRELDLKAATEYAARARGERARPRHGWDSLTPTELRVVELAAAGRSNPEIAERLLMSRSTVKTHLEHVYTKTGIHNRTELAAESVRRSR